MSAIRPLPRSAPAPLTLTLLALLVAVLLARMQPATAAPLPPATAAGRVPEPGTCATGVPFKGTTPAAEVRGYVDAHTHLMAYEAFGGRLFCGKPFDPGGSMFLCHKFDNALCGVRFDSDTTGVIVNLGNFLGTGRFWQVERCAGTEHDNTVQPSGALGDLLRGPLSGLGRAGLTLPLYPSPPHCNVHGLSELGEYALKGLIDRNMIVEIDHMSVKAADRTLAILEERGYSGVVSSHSWMDGNYARRLYRLGGMITGYGHAADRFVREWRANKAHRDPGRAFGYGYGLDANGMGALPPPRPGNDGNRLRYPFTSPIDPGVTLDRQHTGLRTWDVNTEGVANYGLVPDWIADMRTLAGPEITEDLARGAETYLQMWRRAETGTMR
ncbi:hypothetical protein ACQP1W_40525 [Spirillospora sp. CA-255316]